MSGRFVIGREVAQPIANNSTAPPNSIKAGSHQSLMRWMNSLTTRDQIRFSITASSQFLPKEKRGDCRERDPQPDQHHAIRPEYVQSDTGGERVPSPRNEQNALGFNLMMRARF